LRTTAPDLARRYRDEGWWSDDTLGSLLASHLTAHPDLTFRIWSDRHPHQSAMADVYRLALSVAGGLRARGIGPDDVVAFQLPNWVEAAAVFWGVAALGAVVAPIVHFYGPKEVGFILRQSGARALVTVDGFGHVDHLAMLEVLRPDLPALETVAVVSPEARPLPAGAEPFTTLAAAAPIDGPAAVDPDRPALVAYTSGTTADPKGVIHTHRSIVAEIHQLGDLQSDRDRPALVGAPVGHGIGMLSGLLLPVYRDLPIHLIDVWSPPAILAAMLEAGITAGSGATYFLTSLLDSPAFTPAHVELMRFIGLGGSSVPLAVAQRAEALGISIARSFGSTEHPSITGATHAMPAAKRVTTDGQPLLGIELRLVDDDGVDVGAGEPGEILSRGPDLFAGYTDATLTAGAIDADGWYRTEDVGVLDGDGWLTITDRKKDIIIRGGENISAAEVEGLLVGLPGVAEAAVVAAPDARLGEHACAFVRLLPGADTPTLDTVRAHLDAAGLARQKWPEELRMVEDFPRTASGKVQKFVLRSFCR
jgi:acyl-CoA synthetase (AMP-forming)/AMP-acid ligase II